MVKKRKAKKAEIVVPSSLEEAAMFVARLGEEQRAIEEIELELNREIEALKAEAMAEVAAYSECKEALLEGIAAFAEKHRVELTASGNKTVQLPTGYFGWRWTPPSVSLRNAAAVLEELIRAKINKFVRTKHEVNREAMLEDKDLARTIKGVTITQREQFFVKPSEVAAEISVDLRKVAV